jgi:DNA invertase Pin-like site-specific DNA recombinase
MKRVVGYVRVSTREQADSGLGLGAQRRAIRDTCKAKGWRLVKVFEDAGASGKTTNGRHGLIEAQRALREGKAEGLVVAKLDRLSRSLLDFARLMKVSREEGWALVALDLGVDTSTSNGRMVANIMATLAEWERDMISERTTAALAERRAHGARLGRPRLLPDDVRSAIIDLHRAGESFNAIANRLNENEVPTAQSGARWYAATVRKIVLQDASG